MIYCFIFICFVLVLHLINSSSKFDLSTDSDQDVALKLAQERAEIVAKYDKVSIQYLVFEYVLLEKTKIEMGLLFGELKSQNQFVYFM